MKVHIEVKYIHYDTLSLQQGSFPVDSFEYEINPDQAAADSAIRFIRELQRVHSGMQIRKVSYNSIDITEIVKNEIKRLDDEIIYGSDDLPF
ncbi:hypothetical protein [Metabacillus halosaccharovorans]|uniref:DUF3892 domain-containing protein n=1 Tax=Metabacillus halosaccharovorans TaxID=930124 RepID=A0ABT3DCA7_9BACI|nr:hypothetical protein [Metabacillus halosaccharovorans]MCV9884690.1 hypothetical protein [Metabacillus halosaccharovorans]